MSARAASWVAWFLCALTVVLVACAFVLAILLDRSTDVYEYLFSLALVSYALVGGVVASRVPSNPVGWFFLGIAVSLAPSVPALQYATYGLLTDPGSLPAAGAAAWLLSWHYIPGFFLLLSFLPLYFPDGRLPSRRWRWVMRSSLLVAAVTAIYSALRPGEIKDLGLINPLGIEALRPVVALLDTVTFAAFFVVIFVSVASLVVRFRRSRRQERQQIKWLAYAAAAIPVWFLVNYPIEEMSGLLFSVVENLLFAGIPVAVGVAILKHRLYDIDRLINRTLVYGALTMMLAMVYIGCVVGLQYVFHALTGSDSQLAVVASTLAIAALFGPLRRRIQDFIDRRFYRKKYDDARTLEAFSARLRSETDLETLSGDLVSVARETVQPEHVSVWLRSPGGARGNGKGGRS